MGTKKAKPNELKVYWGKEDRRSNPDVLYGWGGGKHEGLNDTKMLHYYLNCKHAKGSVRDGSLEFSPSFIEQLESRGYDITTFKFSIMHKDVDE